MSEPIHHRMARTFDEMVASGDVKVIHAGVNWGVQLERPLTDEDFEVLMDRVLDNSKDHDK